MHSCVIALVRRNAGHDDVYDRERGVVGEASTEPLVRVDSGFPVLLVPGRGGLELFVI